MAKSDTNSKTAADSTPAAAPAESLPAGDDTLEGAGAARGKDVFFSNTDLKSALGIDSAAQDHDETAPAEAVDASADTDDEDTDDEASLDAAAQAALEAEQQDADAEPDAEAEPETAETDAPQAEAAKPEESKPKHEALQARIDELTAGRKTAEEEAARLRERLSTYEAREAGKLDPAALDHVEDEAGLTKAQRSYAALYAWAVKNPDGGVLGDKEYTAEEARAMQAESFELLQTAIPARQEWIRRNREAESAAVDAYPWLKERTKPGTAGYFVQQAIEKEPVLRKLPNYRLIAGDAFIGGLLRQHGIAVTDELVLKLKQEAQARSGGRPAAKTAATRPPVKAPAAPGRAGVLPPRQAPAVAQQRAAKRRLAASGGSESDLAASIAAKLT